MRFAGLGAENVVRANFHYWKSAARRRIVRL